MRLIKVALWAGIGLSLTILAATICLTIYILVSFLEPGPIPDALWQFLKLGIAVSFGATVAGLLCAMALRSLRQEQPKVSRSITQT